MNEDITFQKYPILRLLEWGGKLEDHPLYKKARQMSDLVSSFLPSGGEVDLERMANILLDEFRGGKLGRITLELPEDLVDKESDHGTA